MSDQKISRLQEALLLTGMMNERFVQMITDGEVDAEYIEAAFDNLNAAMHPPKPPVKDRYVLGFVFSEDSSRVLLVWKNRPAWQAGKLNGIGGKIEAGETPLQAMQREFREETLVDGYILKGGDITQELQSLQWHYVGTRGREAIEGFQDGSYEMTIFATTYPDVRDLVAESATYNAESPNVVCFSEGELPDEQIIALPLNREILARKGVPGLAWTVDVALQALREHFYISVMDPPKYGDEDQE
jgi:hypothetical protein